MTAHNHTRSLQTKTAQHATSVSQAIHVEFSGPLPHPEILAKYKEIDPTFPERMLAMWEKQTKFRMMQEERAMPHAIRLSFISLYCATFISFSLIVAAVPMAIYGNAAIGAVVAALGIVGTFASAITANISSKKQDDTK